MPLFDIQTPEVDPHQVIADGLLAFANQACDTLVDLYRRGKEMLWYRDNFTVADAQAVIDALGQHAVPLFTLSAALGQFIAANYPGPLTEDDLAAPVLYTIQNGRIVLDANAEYPGRRAVQPEV